MGNPDSHKMEGLSILEKVENFKKQLELLESKDRKKQNAHSLFDDADEEKKDSVVAQASQGHDSVGDGPDKECHAEAMSPPAELNNLSHGSLHPIEEVNEHSVSNGEPLNIQAIP